ncbi:MAG: hypothetical protein AAGA99_00185 [Actinomycetota bacterium]
MASYPKAPKWSRQRRLAVFGAGAAIIAIFAVAGTIANTEGTGGATHPAVEVLIPSEGAQAVRQTRVEIDLEIGWTAELEINRTTIPLDQIEGFDPEIGRANDPLGRVIFDPGPGKVFDIFPQGQVCVTAYLTNLEEPDERAIESWCFTAA